MNSFSFLVKEAGNEMLLRTRKKYIKKVRKISAFLCLISSQGKESSFFLIFLFWRFSYFYYSSYSGSMCLCIQPLTENFFKSESRIEIVSSMNFGLATYHFMFYWSKKIKQSLLQEAQECVNTQFWSLVYTKNLELFFVNSNFSRTVEIRQGE